MMSENLLSVFKKELGYVNATNQYVELSIKITEKEHSLGFKEQFARLSPKRKSECVYSYRRLYV